MIRPLPFLAAILLLSLAVCADPIRAQQGRANLMDGAIVAPGESPNAALLRRLRANVEFKVEIMPLKDFVKFLSKRYNVTVRLDPDALERASVEPSAPISANITNMRLSTALTQILGRLNLGIRIANGTLLITDRRRPAPAVRAGGGRVVLHNGNVEIIQKNFDAGNPNGALKEQALRQLGPLLQTELIFARRTCKATKDQTQRMRDDVRNYVKDEVNDFFDLMQGRVAWTVGGFHVARKMLDDRLAKFVETNFSKEHAARYREELEKRDANEREVAALNLLALLDRELSLSPKQRDAIKRSLIQNWDDGWGQTIEVGATRGQNFVPSIPDEVIETHLDASQIEVWENMTKIGNANWGFQVFRLGWFGTPVDETDED